ncbi:hypothetical protein UP06_26675 [Bradyrhizobium sp. LTSP857]|nr:hypothetical protein UP06_26675 [Bradyrhizobium sp. LTSP857]
MHQKPTPTLPIAYFDQQQIMLGKISGQSIFDAALCFGGLTFGVFIEVDPRQPVAEFQLQPRSYAAAEVADLF